MFDYQKIRPGEPILARDFNGVNDRVRELSLRTLPIGNFNDAQIPCVLQQDILKYQYLQIEPGSSFIDDIFAWINVGEVGSNWVMFNSDYDAGTTAVCEVIPYDKPVLLRTYGSPQLGMRYDIATMQQDDNGEFTCVGMTKDPEVFWYVRNAGVGGGGGSNFCTIVTPVANGFTNYSLQGNFTQSSPNTTVGWNSCRAGLGRIMSHGTTSNPLKVYTVDGENVVPKNQPLYYKSLSIKRTTGDFPVYNSQGMPTFNEVSSYGTWNGIAAMYAFLRSIRNETAISGVAYDLSSFWETTNNPALAIQDNLVVIKPHRFAGYWAFDVDIETVGTDTMDISTNGRTAKAVAYSLQYTRNSRERLHGQIDWDIYKAVLSGENITWTKLKNLDEYLNATTSVLRIDVQFDGNNPAVIDDNMISNMCSNIATAGLWIDCNGLPQWIECMTIPFNMAIACLAVNCLYRISQKECSPSYKIMSYPILFGTNALTVGVVNYIPSYKPCS